MYIGRNSRTERSRKTKIGTYVAHITRHSDTTFRVKRSKVKVTRPLCSPSCWRIRRLQRWAWERVGCGKLLLRYRLLGGARRFGARGGRRGAGHIVAAAHLQFVTSASAVTFCLCWIACQHDDSKMSTNCNEFFEGWDVSRATKHPMLVHIWITIRIPEFLTEFLPQRDGAL